MKALDLALICSGSPGFFRSLGALLGQTFRLMECFTQLEAAQMIQLHRPTLAVIDLRGAQHRQLARTWAMIEANSHVRFVLVTMPDQIDERTVPNEIHQRFEIEVLGGHETGLTDLSRRILEPDPERRAQSAVARPLAVSSGSASSVLADSVQSEPAADNRRTADSSQGMEQSTGMPVETIGGLSDVAASISRTPSSAAAASEPVGKGDEPSIADRFRTRTPELRQMLRRLEVAARHHVTMLLIGETGSGKTHLASLIHDFSPRAAEPFLHVACGALPGELIESELFGHVKGAFTSAHADKDGKFLAAGNGTILLDEIDVLSPDQQVKLLRVIEKGEFEPVGSNKTLHVRARIIAASNLQLQPLVEQGRFRPDLYYRLNTLSFTIPPLRKRLPDIEPLARYFVHRHAAQLGIEVVEISQAFLDCLLSYPWPGNVREMENAIRSAVIYSDNGRMTPDTLPGHIVEGHAGPANDPSVAAFFAGRQGDSLESRIEITEKDLIEQALLNHNFSRTNTARHLGISRVTLYNKMRKYGILPDR